MIHSKTRRRVALLAITWLGFMTTGYASATQQADVAGQAEALLNGFVEDYKHDPMALDATFGIKLGESMWTVDVERLETPSRRGTLTDHSFGPHRVSINRGEPDEPTWYFELASLEVLEKIANGEVNAGTAAMQSFGSDQVGVEIRSMEGFEMTSGDQADYYVALSHFFTKGHPVEVTQFSRERSLETHGVQATALHMTKAARILHFSIVEGEAANDDPRLEYSQTPNLFIVTGGKGSLTTNDDVIDLEPGVSVYVPQFAKHVLRSRGSDPLEGILVLYGDNSDFAFGTSFPSYQQDLNNFHREYAFGTRPAKGE